MLESFYETAREQVAEAIRSLIAFESVVSVDPALLLRAVEVYETDWIDFAEAYLVACAKPQASTGLFPSTRPSISWEPLKGSTRQRSRSRHRQFRPPGDG